MTPIITTMSAPYTPDTIAAIRVQARRKVPPRAIALLLGWDLTRLMEIAKKHEIALAQPALTQVGPPKLLAGGKRLVANVNERRGVSWDLGTKMVSYRGRDAKLTPQEIHILGCLVRADAPLDPHLLVHKSGVRWSVLRARISGMRKKLEGVGLSITSGRAKGYQLVMVKP